MVDGGLMSFPALPQKKPEPWTGSNSRARFSWPMNVCNSFSVAPYCMFLISYFTSQSAFRAASFSDEKVVILDDAALLRLNP
ncbi:hypothetical protein MUK42_11718 [Musa troglodytarum]|uniref:Uncharacterized protein n=1 Tax=Musa troglodytarum TaxID=320322 RepID=A0A9E7FVJ0_9LILI|nr:hypothetical protein MUK42_11718 [Musa troglodytarum]